MKRLFLCCCTALLCTLPLHARINLFQPWYPGQDLSIGKLHAYQASAGIIKGNALTDIPVALTYNAQDKLEVGGQWGIRSVAGYGGISDLLLGVKYQFLDGSVDEMPQVAGEAALSLPTANSNEGLGTGGVGLLLHWVLAKEIQDVTGYFGLGIQLNSENSDHYREGSVFSYHLGAGYNYDEQWRLYGEFKGFNHAAGSAYN